MSGARVQSIDALRDLRSGLARFALVGQEALAAVNIELHRVADWLEAKLAYWRQEIRQRQEEVNRARSNLSLQRSLQGGRGGGTTEAEITLQQAMHRLREAEEKVVVVRKWIGQLPEVVREYEAIAHRLSGHIEADLKMTVALLDQKVAALTAYAAEVLPPTPEASSS